MSEEDRCDCVQEVWAELITRLDQFRYDPQRGKLRTWLHALVRNNAVDVIRRRRRHPSGSLGDTLEKSLCRHEPDPASEYERHEIQATVQDALGRLSREASRSSYQVLYLRWVGPHSARDRGGARPDIGADPLPPPSYHAEIPPTRPRLVRRSSDMNIAVAKLEEFRKHAKKFRGLSPFLLCFSAEKGSPKEPNGGKLPTVSASNKFVGRR